ncbi:MAG TPA: endonuclease/exonuclease/phosphatase family protein [Candidatus Eisenbacteria bacterium]|nr:endonuclease/exonuclease/phosphatase family protein [Candidatus Eisenbacteria bacterium]
MILRLLTYNIQFGGAGREAQIAATIESASPDLVVLQEATRPDVVSRVAAATGMKAWASTRGHSVGFMSRIDVAEHHWYRPRGTLRAFLEIVLAGSNMRVFGIHLTPLHSNWTERWRVRELKATLASIARHQHGFHVLAGDFNTLAPDERLDLGRLPPGLQLLALLGGSTIRWQTIRIMLDAHYLDAYRTLHPGVEGYTFPTWDPHVRLDYVFVPGASAGRLKRCEIVDGPPVRAASDHFPLLADLEVP